MANKKISELAVSGALAGTEIVPIVKSSATVRTTLTTIMAFFNSAAATLTNKTLTSPVIYSPTGIVKADVGLSNVDNTSDTTKNAATVTLTNKTLTSPVISSPSGLTKTDVGLSNVDNTSDATKNTSAATLTNKTLTTPVINSPSGIVKGDVGLGSVDNTSDISKPVSTATQTALNLKQNTLAHSPVMFLAQSAVAVSLTGTTSETTLATITVPANSMGANGSVRITTTWSVTNSANNKTLNTKFDGTIVAPITLTTSATYKEQRQIYNRNATNSQLYFSGVFGGYGSSGGAIGTMAKDTTTSKDITITAQLVNSGETITLEAYTVEILPI